MSRNTSEQEQSSPNFLKRKIAATAVLTGLTAAALTGCATGQAEGHEPAPTSTSSEAPAPEETQTPVETTPELVTSYDKLNYADFETKEQTGRLQYVDYKLEENKDEHAGLLESRNRPEFVELTKDSSPQDILNHFLYVNDEANYQSRPDAQNGGKIHDVDSAIKYLSGAYDGVLSTPDTYVSNDYLNYREKHISKATEAPFAVDLTLTATGTSGIQEGDIRGENRIYQDIEAFTNTGNDASGRWVYVEYPDLKTGETEGTWLLDEFTNSPE